MFVDRPLTTRNDLVVVVGDEGHRDLGPDLVPRVVVEAGRASIGRRSIQVGVGEPDPTGDALAVRVVHRIGTRFLDLLSPLPHGIGDAWTQAVAEDRKSTRLNSSHVKISYAVFCLKKKTSLSTGGG